MTKVVRNVISAIKEGRFKTKPDGTKFIEVPKTGWNLSDSDDLDKFNKVLNELGWCKGWKMERVMAKYDSNQIHHFELILLS